jgi:lysyl-tRNA synthetase class 2
VSAGDWRPTASLDALRLRARLLEATRRFFAEREVLEVETPLLGAAAATDPNIESLVAARADAAHPTRQCLYLQSSPEFALKRLLAAHGVALYQLGKAFRGGERGSLHNPEFTLLEWYRPGWDHRALMGEVEDLLERLLGTGRGVRVTYREAFLRAVGVDPLQAPDAEVAHAALALGLAPSDVPHGREACLDFLFATRVQPGLGPTRLVFVYDFPASHAALARVRGVDPPVAERFEGFVDGIEVANGYHELADPVEQRRRFQVDLARRQVRGLPQPPLDERLLAALEQGLPDCAGVAVGFDRLVMAAARARRIDEVLAFPSERA